MAVAERDVGSVDALIVGAGPVGLTMAGELRRHGVACRIVDTAAARTDKSKALVLWSRSLELLETAGAVQPFLAAGRKAHGASIYADGRRLLQVALDRIDSTYAYALMIPQSETERLLEERLTQLGTDPERQVELLGFAADEGGVRATLRRADGAQETVHSSWLIGCDGAHSTVRHGLGLDFAGEAEPSDWILADIRLDGPVADDELSIYFHAEGLLAFFPISPGRFRAIADLGPARDDAHPPDPTLAEVQTLLDERGPGGIRAHDPVWLAGFRIHERKVKEYSRGRVFLAGDAAHIHSPAGGQGMNTGMQDAFNLGWKLGLVRSGRGRATPLLDSYSAERSPIGDEVLRNAGALTWMATLRYPVAQALRNRVYGFLGSLHLVNDVATRTLAELSVNYRSSPLCGESRGLSAHAWLLGGGVPPGDRAPDAPLADLLTGDELRAFELLRSGTHVALLLTGASATEEQCASLAGIPQAIRERFRATVAPYFILSENGQRDAVGGGAPALLDTTSAMHRRHAAAEPTIVLLRPDGYVGFRAQPADAAALLQHLDSYLIPS